jgi:tellurite methyltransferase
VEGERYTPADLADLLHRRSGEAVLVDLRGPKAHRRAHPRGAVSIPSGRLLETLYLLPPRRRRLILFGAAGPEESRRVRHLSGELRRRGWTGAGWLDGSVRELDAGLLASGAEPNRIWEPAARLRRLEPLLPREGAACDLACGSGRNAVFLALGGRRVIGADILPDALRQGRGLARAARVPSPGAVGFVQTDLRDAQAVGRLLRPERFSLITCFRYLHRPLFNWIEPALAPGGWIVYETFLTRQAESGGKPRSPAHLLEPGELRRAFPGMEVVDYFEGQDEGGDWVASLAARRTD